MTRALSFLLLAVVALPVVGYAQTAASVEAQVRAAIEAEAAAQGLSEADVAALVSALAEKAGEAGVTATDIEATFAPETVDSGEYGDAYFADMPEELGTTAPGYDGTQILALLGGFILLMLLYGVWKKMEHGGALGGASLPREGSSTSVPPRV